MPGLDLAVDLGDTNAVGPIHQPAAVAREAETIEPHYVDIAGAVCLALFEDLAGLVDRGKEQPAEDLLVTEGSLRDAEFGRLLLDHAGEVGVGMRGAVALLVAEPSGACLLAQSPGLDDHVGDRHLAVVRVLRRAPLAAIIADVETRQIGGRKRPDRIAEIDHDFVDLLGERSFFDHEVHLGAKRPAAAIGDKAVAIAGHRTDLADLAAQPIPVANTSGALFVPLTTSNNFMTLAGAKKCVPATSCGRLVALAMMSISMPDVFE